MKVFTKQLDLSNNYKELLDKLSNIPIPKDGVDVIICNFAIHYFINDEKNLINLINLRIFLLDIWQTLVFLEKILSYDQIFLFNRDIL